MGLGVSLFLIAVGAILVWGVQTEIAGISEDAIGVILMIVGAAGILLSLLFWSSWGGTGAFGARPTSRKGRRPPDVLAYLESNPPSGSTAAPRSRTSKWRCGPDARPLAPSRPTRWPGSTR